VVAEKVLCDEVVIRHVEQDRLGQIGESIGKDPSRIPQVVFLSLLEHDADPRRSVQVHLAKPRATLNSHVFKILVHTDAVEDLMFYHYPREELIVDGKIPWRDFSWQYGRADGDLEEDELHPITRACRPPDQFTRRHPRDDEDHDRERKRTSSKGFLGRMSSCIDPG
jgi:hypothetical protein